MAQQLMNHAPNYREVLFAELVACVLVLTGGLTYRLIATPVNKTPIDPIALEGFPLQVYDWTGHDVPLDDILARATETDAHINRRYSRADGSGSISLYVACGSRADEVMGHHPEMCYTAAGWTLLSRRSVQLPLDTGATLPCTVFEFTRGGLHAEKTTVLHYFIVDDQYCRDISLLRSMAWGRLAAIGCLGQVHIVTSTKSLTDDSGTRLVSAFAVDSASSITRLFEDVTRIRRSGETPEPLTER